MGKPSDKVLQVSVTAVILLVLFIVGANVLGNIAGYYGTVKKMVGCIRDNDVDKLEACASSISIAVLGGEEKAHEIMTANISQVMKECNETVGRITGTSYTVTNEQEISKDNLASIKEKLENQYGMDTSGIKRILRVGLKIKIKGEIAARDYQRELYLVRETGGWKLYDGEL